jgi:hypothetical protein
MYNYIQQTMNAFFPESIISLIHEYAGTKAALKQYFSNEVLPSINKGYRLVGMFCAVHPCTIQCDCVAREPCAACYIKTCTFFQHTHYDVISYDETEHMRLYFPDEWTLTL